jgi:methylglutaconyl-CoA hydratase
MTRQVPFNVTQSTVKFLVRHHRQSLAKKHFLQARSSSSAPAKTILQRDVPAPHAGSIRILSLNRPEARNAISKQLLSELRRNVDELAAGGPVRALILASEDDSCFCAGADLKV